MFTCPSPGNEIGSCDRRIPGATSVMSVVASSRSSRVGAPPCSCTPRPYLDRAVKRQSASGLGRSLGGRARLEDVLAVPAELFYRLADVVEDRKSTRLNSSH